MKRNSFDSAEDNRTIDKSTLRYGSSKKLIFEEQSMRKTKKGLIPLEDSKNETEMQPTIPTIPTQKNSPETMISDIKKRFNSV